LAWFWTDDLARLLLDAELAEEPSVRSWIDRPVAISGPDDAEPLTVALELAAPPGAAAGAA
jgi:hypothetical protein